MSAQRRLIGLLLAIIIPILATVFIINYSYNWEQFQTQFRREVISKGKTSEESIDNYINFISYKYQKEPFIHEVVKDDEGNVLFEFKIIRTVSLVQDKPDEVRYRLFLYNVNYDKIGLNKTKFDFNILIHVEGVQDDEENYEEIPHRRTVFYDSYYLKDLGGNPHSTRYTKPLYVKERQFYAITDFPKDKPVRLIISYTGLKYDQENREFKPSDPDNYIEFLNIEFDDFTFDVDDLDIDSDDYAFGYNDDIKKAGYNQFIFKTKIWWIALLTLLVTGIITFSFYFVWEYENKMKQQAKSKRKR